MHFKDRFLAAMNKAFELWLVQNPNADQWALHAYEIEAHPDILDQIISCFPAWSWDYAGVNFIDNPSLTMTSLAFSIGDRRGPRSSSRNGVPF